MRHAWISVIVPVLNEESCIARFIEGMRDQLVSSVSSWEILVVDDGSTDRTREIVEAHALADDRVRLVTGPHRGKGAAVRQGMLAAAGEWRFMADADLSMPPDNLARFVAAARDAPAPDVVIASREAPGARRVGEPWHRHAAGRVFNWMVRLLAVPGIRDTQCGYKLLSARAAESLAPRLTIDGFAFDVELLFLARRAGLDIREVGIEWHARRDGRVDVRRGAAAFLDILRIRWRQARRGYAIWAYLLAAIFAGAIAYDLLRMPVQVYDSAGEIRAAALSPSAWASFRAAFGAEGYFRPLRIAQIKALFDFSGGNYWLAYRGFHAVLLAACFALFTRALRVRTAADLAAAAFALTVLMGLHTFRGTVQEAFPINHFLEITACCLLALNLAQSRGGAWVDAAAIATMVAAALTLESGLLVWVVAIAAWLAGARGVSLKALAGMTLVLAGYLYVRFAYSMSGVPTLAERSSGYLLAVLDPPELQARFGERPYLFYAYNVAASALSVLLSEPQSGVFVGIRSWLRGELPPRIWLAIGSSAITTGLIAWAAVRAMRVRSTRDAPALLLPLFAVVLAANSVLSFAYTKDEIMSIAGAFYALAAYAAVRMALERASSARAVAAATLALALFAAGAGWAVRSAGVHHVLRLQAFRHRGDWGLLPVLQQPPLSGRGADVTERLRHEALRMTAPSPYFHPRWTDDLWGD